MSDNRPDDLPGLSNVKEVMFKILMFVKGGMLTAVAVKAGLVVLNFTLISLAARLLEADAFGYYSILFSAIGLLSVVATIGQEPFVLRMWNEITAAGDAARLKGVLGFTFALCMLGTSVAALGYWVWASSIVGHLTVITSLIYLCIFPLVLICMHLVRTEIGIALGDGLGNALIVSAPILYLFYCVAADVDANLSDLFLALAIGSCLALTLQILIITRRVLCRYPEIIRVRALADYKEWIPRSTKFWFATSLGAISQYIDVIVIGYLMDPVVAGAYFVISRLANLFAAAADTIDLVGSRHLPGLYYRKEKSALVKMLDNLAWMALAFNVIGLVGILVGGYFILQLINEPYTEFFPELLVLCVGTAAVGTVRTSTIMLMMTGYEGRFLQILGACLILRIICFSVFIPQFGILGAVIATAISFTAQAAAIRWSDKSLTGQDSSMFRLLKQS
jgi:O-antigen/teichoic acid export membrane protein